MAGLTGKTVSGQSDASANKEILINFLCNKQELKKIPFMNTLTKTVLPVLFSGIFLFSSFWMPLQSQDNGSVSLERQKQILDSVALHPSGIIYILDDKEIPEIEFFRLALGMGMDFNRYYQGMAHAMGKEAILRFGEKYRYGIIGFKAIEQKKENEKTK